MHMGHCRGAVVGDALARLLESAGHAVTREYYVNDAGGQVDTLARSAHLRYREALGQEIGEIPEGLYPGDYLKPVGDALAAEFGDRYADAPESEWLDAFRAPHGRGDARADQGTISPCSASITISSRPSARCRNRARSIARWRCSTRRGWSTRARLPPPKGKTAEDWEPTELLLFRSTQFGDDQDRPIKKSDGSWTYFAADTAYHLQKLEEVGRADQRLGRRPYRHGQAHPGGGRGAGRPAGARRQAGPDGAAAARRRAGQDVEALGQLRHPRRSGRGGRQGRRPLHHADPQERRADGFRLRQGGRGVEGQSGLLRPICPCPDPLAARARRRRRGSTCRRPADLSLLDEEELALVKLRRPIPAHRRGRRRWRTSRTASPSISTISPPRSTRCGTAAMTTRSGVSSSTESRIYSRAAGIGDWDRADCPQRPRHHGGGGGRGDAVDEPSDMLTPTMTRALRRAGCPGWRRSRRTSRAAISRAAQADRAGRLIGLAAIGVIVGGILLARPPRFAASGPPRADQGAAGTVQGQAAQSRRDRHRRRERDRRSRPARARTRSQLDLNAVPETPVAKPAKPRSAPQAGPPKRSRKPRRRAEAGTRRRRAGGPGSVDPARRLRQPGAGRARLERAVGALPAPSAALSKHDRPRSRAASGSAPAPASPADARQVVRRRSRPPARTASSRNEDAVRAIYGLAGLELTRRRARLLPRRRSRRLHPVPPQLREPGAAARADRRSARPRRARRRADPDRPGRRPGGADAAAGLAGLPRRRALRAALSTPRRRRRSRRRAPMRARWR